MLRRRRGRFGWVPWFAVLVGVAVSHGASADTWPTQEWPRTTPETVALDAAALASLDAQYENGTLPLVDSFLVIRCGAIVYERSYRHDYAQIYGKEARQRGPLNPHLSGPYNYFDPAWHPYYHGTREHTMQSVTKSVAATTIGVAITRGDFKASLDTPVLHYFKDRKVKNLDSRKEHMTLRHVLTMTTGLDWNEDLPYNDPHNPTAPMEASRDWVGLVIDTPMANEPGSTFSYSSGASELLAHIFRRETGQDIEVYARRHLFAPLGIRHYHWKRTPLGVVDTEGGLYLRNEDLAKIGYLYLHHGAWNGRQLISPDWIRDAVSEHVTASYAGSSFWKYGYQWWLAPYDSGRRLLWAARGMGGQRLMIFPDEDLIAVTTAWHILDESKPYDKTLIDTVSGAAREHRCDAPH